MSKNLRKCLKTMHLYSETESNQLKNSIMTEMSKNECFFDALYEIVNNIYLKNLKLKRLTLAQKREMRKFARLMHKIHKCPSTKLSRRKLVKQSGGFIQYIIPFVAEAVLQLIKNAGR